jgi:hypothetical protein
MNRFNYGRGFFVCCGLLLASVSGYNMARADDASDAAKSAAQDVNNAAKDAAQDTANAAKSGAESAERSVSSETSKVLSTCKNDVNKICTEYKSQPTQAVDCLKSHKDELSSKCRKDLESSASSPSGSMPSGQ